MNTKKRTLRCGLSMLGTIVLSSTWGYAQSTAQPAAGQAPKEDEEVLVLSPFEVSAEEDTGYASATTLAGNRLNTELRDIGNAVTVINSQFLKDIAATNNETLLQYTVGTEVGSVQGNFAGTGDSAFLDESTKFTNPNQNTRVRGLAEADNTRDYFLSDIPWDGFNVDRVDLQRGPNSILFGMGSPAGIINVGLKQASYRNANEVAFQTDQWGSTRLTADFNRVLKKDELAVRVMAVREKEKFQQDPAFEDDDRVMGAVRWEPKFLRKGSARTIVKASYENGNISSNRPRTLPPLDLITPWFLTGTYQGRYPSDDPATQIRDPNTGQIITYTKGAPRTFNNLNKQTFNPHTVMDDNSGLPNAGYARPKINGGVDNGRLSPYYQPWLGNYGQQFGGPNGFFATDGGTPSYWLWEIRGTRGINSNGVDDNNVGEFAFHRPVGIATAAAFAKNAKLPFAEVYKNYNLSDPTVFDFYNNLLDGPNKSEWSDFDSMTASLAQTFMDDKFGFEFVYNEQNYRNGQLALLDGERQAIYIDMMSVYSDGTAAGKDGVRFQDGTPNPNVGRAFVTDSGQGGNRSYESKRESSRATAFFIHDFTKNSDSGFAKFLGRHTFTGLWSEDNLDREDRSWQRYAVLDMNYWTMFDGGSGIRFTDNAFAVNRIIYLGNSLASRSSASGAYLPRLQNVNNATSGTIRFFDSTWKATNVNPADPWQNPYYPVIQANGTAPDTRRNSFQSENSANYVGWVNLPFQITDSEASQQNRDALTTNARLRRNKVESKAFVWQAHLFDGGLVGTYGYREDTAGASEFSQQASARPAPGFLNWDPSFYTLDGKTWNELSGTSRSYSIVAHTDELPGLKNLSEKLPVRVTLFYNKAENFQPFAGRRDVYGQDIALPAGTTKDLGILLETKDGKYSLKLNKYETEVLNANSNSLNGSWFIGASQQWSGNWVNIFELNWRGGDASTADNPPNPTNSRYNWQDAPDREAAAIAAWRAWQQDPISKKLTTAWGIDVNNRTSGLSSTAPAGFTITEDSFSEGYEIELNAQPTRNWRLTLNASKTSATRKNIGGANLAEFVQAYETFLNKTAVDANGATWRPGGDLRIWWGGAGNETALYQWNLNVGSNYLARHLQENSNVPELREWRLNAISNYDFTEGRLKGVNVGAALRYQSDVVIGYPAIPNPDKSVSYPEYVFDIGNPYKGPAETDIDLWIGYGRKLADRVDWRIQLNVRSVGKGNDLIPITTQPDGTPAGYRIAPRQYWSLTNTFRF